MRLPTRKSELLKRTTDDDGPIFMTAGGIQKLKDQLETLEKKELPEAIQDVKTTGELGDFSENAAYSEAKSRMRRIHSRILSLKERLKRVEVIKKSGTDRVQLGSTVVLDVGGAQKTFEIVGPQEANPARSRISHVSPLGSALLGAKLGETIKLASNSGQTLYRIVEIT